MTRRSAITFALIFTKHIAFRDLMTMLKYEPVRSQKRNAIGKNNDIGAAPRASPPAS
jgi:hypothetical protein